MSVILEHETVEKLTTILKNYFDKVNQSVRNENLWFFFYSLLRIIFLI